MKHLKIVLSLSMYLFAADLFAASLVFNLVNSAGGVDGTYKVTPDLTQTNFQKKITGYYSYDEDFTETYWKYSDEAPAKVVVDLNGKTTKFDSSLSYSGDFLTFYGGFAYLDAGPFSFTAENERGSTDFIVSLKELMANPIKGIFPDINYNPQINNLAAFGIDWQGEAQFVKIENTPIPGALWLMISGLGVLFGFTRKACRRINLEMC